MNTPIWIRFASMVALVAAAACGATDAQPPDNADMDAVAVVDRRDLEITAEAPGSVEPIRVIQVKSKASGEVLALHAEIGDRVEQGALLAEIDPRDVRNALAQAEADLEVARVRARIAEEQRKRSSALLESEVITEQEYETAVLEAANAQASLIRAQTNLELAEERMQDVTIRAPIDGTVMLRDVEVGQIIASATSNVSGGTTLFTMADLAEVQIRVLVDEIDIGRIEPGMTSRVIVEAYPDRAFQGEVLKIEPQAVVDQNVTMFPVLIRLENPERLLKPGMNTEVIIEIANRPDVVTVPNAAVVSVREAVDVGTALGVSEDAIREVVGGPGAGMGPGGRMAAASEVSDNGARGPRPERPSERAADGRTPGIVFLQSADEPEPRRVMLGVSDWERTEVLSGLEPGDRVLRVSIARVLQAQEELLGRIRERTGGPFRSESE